MPKILRYKMLVTIGPGESHNALSHTLEDVVQDREHDTGQHQLSEDNQSGNGMFSLRKPESEQIEMFRHQVMNLDKQDKPNEKGTVDNF